MNSQEILAGLQKKLGSADFSKWRVFRWKWYDYVRYPVAGTNRLTFFSIPLGGTDPNSSAAKTLEDTNMNQSGNFGQVFYIVNAIQTHVSVAPLSRQVSTISGDANVIYSEYTGLMDQLLNLSRQGVFQMTIGQKLYYNFQQPFTYAPPGMGLDIRQHGSATSSTTYQSRWFQQSPWERDVKYLAPAQMIEPNQNFEVAITFPFQSSPNLTGTVLSVNPSVNIGVQFDGIIARPVQ
jgi:hypothetical protein